MSVTSGRPSGPDTGMAKQDWAWEGLIGWAAERWLSCELADKDMEEEAGEKGDAADEDKDTDEEDVPTCQRPADAAASMRSKTH